MAVRKLMLFAALAGCLAIAGPAWAGSLTFNGFTAGGQGALSFTPGLGNALTIGAGNGGNGALVTDVVNNLAICGNDCHIVGGYLTLTSGPETSGFTGGGIFSYSFGAGGHLAITGEIPVLGINTPTVLFMATLLPGTTLSGAGTVGSFLAQLNLTSIVLVPQLGTYKFTGASNDDLSFGISPSCSTGGICTGSLVQSTTSLQTIPEPATLSVLGVGLFTFGTGLRRRMAANKAL
jgi:hypothetical protein